MSFTMVCGKCKEPVIQAKSMKIHSRDTTHKGVCIPCYTKRQKWLKSRGKKYDSRYC
jgi:formylmethanofuran dehydrogenase subunit E